MIAPTSLASEADYRAALARVEVLMSTAAVNTPEGDELDTLTTLVESYETEHYPLDPVEPPAPMNYPVVLTPAAEGGFVATFPDVPEAITQGEDRASALAAARDALETALEFYVDANQTLPRPSEPAHDQDVISPSAATLNKLAINSRGDNADDDEEHARERIDTALRP